MKKENTLQIVIGTIFVLLLSALLYMNPNSLKSLLSILENAGYDLQVREDYKPVSKDSPIAIIDIDDASINEIGRWPWSRDKVAQLVSKLFGKGASLVAFDITFPLKEENIAEEVAQAVEKEGGGSKVLSELDRLKPQFDTDAIFAKSLEMGTSVLGCVFLPRGSPIGMLPPPLLTLTPDLEKDLFIPDESNYLANIEILQKAAKNGGFLNATPDSDGIIRYSPLLIRRGNQVYPSLALEACRQYLLAKKTELITAKYGALNVLEGIDLDGIEIPTDPYGRILVPFRGPPYSTLYISALDVLNDKEPENAIKDKLLFIGSSATAAGDLVATSVSPIFAGVEIHADIASGIIEGYMPYRPAWGHGVSVFLVLLLGLISVSILPYLGPFVSTAYALFLPALLILANRWIWAYKGLVLSIEFPILTVGILYVVNLVSNLYFEKKRREGIVSIFGHYLPQERIDIMIRRGSEFSLEGETKELTVLFADIRSFTSVSEGMTAEELKQLLNRYLTPMTKVIFDHKGTVDKYVGDLIMAFWGAPVEDPQHAGQAVASALAMQEQLGKINQAEKKPIRIGVGVNTGLMNVGDMGSEYRRAYTVLGDEVNLASRIEGVCRYYNVKVIVGENTYLKTKELFQFRKLDRAKVLGRLKAVLLYEPICRIDASDAATISRLEKHNKAIDAYFQQNWGEAETLFRELLGLDPASADLYQIYLTRIAKFKQTPPGPDWDGSYVFEGK